MPQGLPLPQDLPARCGLCMMFPGLPYLLGERKLTCARSPPPHPCRGAPLCRAQCVARRTARPTPTAAWPGAPSHFNRAYCQVRTGGSQLAHAHPPSPQVRRQQGLVGRPVQEVRVERKTPQVERPGRNANPHASVLRSQESSPDPHKEPPCCSLRLTLALVLSRLRFICRTIGSESALRRPTRPALSSATWRLLLNAPL